MECALRGLWGCSLCPVVLILKWEFRAEREVRRKRWGVDWMRDSMCMDSLWEG